MTLSSTAVRSKTSHACRYLVMTHESNYLALMCSVYMKSVQYLGSAIIYDLELCRA